MQTPAKLRCRIALLALVSAGTVARADDAQPSSSQEGTSSTDVDPQPSSSPEDTASSTDVASAPAADEASGQRRALDDGPSPLRVAAQIVLFVPRWATWVAFAPVRGGLWLFNRFQLGDQFERVFFNDEGTLGLFPVAFFETGFGLNVGGRFIYRDLFGRRGKLSARASYGGQFRQLYSAKASTGRLLGDRLEAELEGEFQLFPKSRFFGIGNEGEISDPPMAGMLIDPLVDDTAVRTRYRHDDYRVELAAVVRLWRDLSLRVSGQYKHREFEENAMLGGDDVDIVDAYEPASLIGFDTGLSNFYPEAELVWDSRRRVSPYVSAANPGIGSKLSAFIGYQHGIDDDASDHARYGFDIQHHVDLFAGDRYLILRGYLEAVTGSIDEVSFVDLPRLGGPTFLRGYDRDRFRDRIATLYTAEYNYPLPGNVSAYLFADAGRVYRDYGDIDLASLEDLHVGFGGGIQAFTKNTFIARVSLFSSIDGGLFFNVSFDPVFDTRSREESP